MRELEHVISRVAVKALSLQQQCAGIVTINRDMLNDIAPATDEVLSRTVTTSGQHTPVSLRQAVTEAQRGAISTALQRNEQRWAPTARELKVDPSNLHKLARKLGLKGVS